MTPSDPSFVSSVTHELKSPLASLQLAFETMGRPGVDDSTAADVQVDDSTSSDAQVEEDNTTSNAPTSFVNVATTLLGATGLAMMLL